MAPPKKGYENEQEAAANKNHTMYRFLKKEKGRPKKRGVQIEANGVAINGDNSTTTKKAKTAPNPATAAVATASTSSNKKAPKKTTATRTNWSKGANLIQMTKAVNNWLVKDSPHNTTLDDNGEAMTLQVYAHQVDIPYPTLKKYVTNNTENRRKLGSITGPSSSTQNLQPHDLKLIEQCVVRHDRANNPKDVAACVTMVQDLNPKT